MMTRIESVVDRLGSKALRFGGACMLLLSVGGCSSWLDIDESKQADVIADKRADGIALNRPQNYAIEIVDDKLCQIAGSSGLECTEEDFKQIGNELVGIDQRYLLIVNATRMPFSSAGLTVKTTDKQIAKEIGLEAKTGAASLPKAASAALDAKADREKAKLDAQQKEDQAKAQEAGS